jgi:23S rRNA (guanosine2251-2'-O)-methyltransferase
MPPDREPFYAGTPHADRPAVPRNPVRVVLDNIRSAFNVGSIFRTADAGAVEHMYLCGMTTHPPNDKLAKTALGAFDYVPWSHHWETGEVLTTLRKEGVPIVAVEVTDDAESCYTFDWPRPVAIVFGHEVQGIQPDMLARCDATVKIPMSGFKNSINVATAFGVVLYEILRRWDAIA